MGTHQMIHASHTAPLYRALLIVTFQDARLNLLEYLQRSIKEKEINKIHKISCIHTPVSAQEYCCLGCAKLGYY